MFNNWINMQDVQRLMEKIARGEWRQVLRKLSLDDRGRTRSAWEHTQAPPENAWEIPALRRRWNLLVSGDAQVDHVAYICRKFLPGKKDMNAFSPGCGAGSNEMRWAETGLFRRIDACDLSPQRIAAARQGAESRGLGHILNFQVGDLRALGAAGPYDLVIAEGALHHFYPMHRALEKIKGLLRPSGMLIVNEFVGPSRFQWTGKQLQAANALLAGIPEKYRRRWPDGKVKKRIDAPGRLRMKLADPSEAAESSLILPLLREMFTPLEIKNKGGTLACLVFHRIAHHFLQADEAAAGILSSCFAAEDRLMQDGEIASDYILGVFLKPLA